MSDPTVDEASCRLARERLIQRFSEPTDLSNPDVMCEAWRDRAAAES